MSELEEFRDFLLIQKDAAVFTFDFKPSPREELVKLLDAFIKYQEEKHYGDRR